MTKRVGALVFLIFAAVPNLLVAQTQPPPQTQAPPTYSKGEMDARINELRVDYNAQMAALRALIDRRSSDAMTEVGREVAEFKSSDEVTSYAGPIAAAVVGAIIGGLVIWLQVRNDNRQQRQQRAFEAAQKNNERRQKQIESTLEFSRRFGELLQLQSELNQAYALARTAPEHHGKAATKLETHQARTWWWLFFDLLLYEYDFFKQNLVWDERFTEWIRWRWYDFHAEEDDAWKTCGMDYKMGWQHWKDRPANKRNRLTEFLEKVHRAQDIQEVERIVSQEPRPTHEEYRLRETEAGGAAA